MCDQLEDNWEEQTVENFEGIAKGIISSLGMIENVSYFMITSLCNILQILMAVKITVFRCIFLFLFKT